MTCIDPDNCSLLDEANDSISEIHEEIKKIIKDLDLGNISVAKEKLEAIIDG